MLNKQVVEFKSMFK